MDIRFDYKGTPNGGCILNYLLEKARVISHSKNERNFHIFYQLVNGADDALLNELGLDRDIFKYAYLVNSKAVDIETEIQERMSGEDAENFKEIQEAFDVCDFKQEDRLVSIESKKKLTFIMNLS